MAKRLINMDRLVDQLERALDSLDRPSEQGHTWIWRDPFAGVIEGYGLNIEDAIATEYEDIPYEERPAYVWYEGRQVSVPWGVCTPLQ